MIAAFVDDLLFRSKIRAAASHTGAAVSFFRDPADEAIAGVSTAIVDLDGPQAVALVAGLRALRPELRIVGFVSHVQTDLIDAARQAGVGEVMARSAFTARLAEILTRA